MYYHNEHYMSISHMAIFVYMAVQQEDLLNVMADRKEYQKNLYCWHILMMMMKIYEFDSFEFILKMTP